MPDLDNPMSSPSSPTGRYANWKPGKSADGESDIRRAYRMAEALGIDESDKVHGVVIPGPPWSKSRPRFSKKGHTYKPRDDEDAEQRTAWYLRSAVREPFLGNVGLACVFYRPNRQRIDTDNLIKHVCDAATGVLWQDDSQCTAVMGVIELDADNPRTVLIVGKHVSTLTRGDDATFPCAHCGKPISLVGRTSRAQTCSRQCSQRRRGVEPLTDPVPCALCGTPFKRFTASQKHCSLECGHASTRGKPKGNRKPQSMCTECGKELSHRRGGRCRDCWRVGTKWNSKPAAPDGLPSTERDDAA